VQDPLLVGGGESRAELAGYLNGFVLREAADSPKQRCKVFSVDVLHREVVLAIDFADVVNTADVGVRDFEGRLDFVEEAVEADLVSLHRRRQELQRHRLAELQVISPVDLSHAAAAEQADDAISIGKNSSRMNRDSDGWADL
jgi:hypothetical protein